MTRKESLEALLVKVEAGEYDAIHHSCAVSDDMYPNLDDAYNGSLDAAKALHEAVLGDGYVSNGFSYTIYGSGKVSVWNIITDASGRGEVNAPDLHNIAPARAWLIAIIKALIAESDLSP